jgi:hypothetical protein
MPPAGRLSRPPILFCKSGLTDGRIAYPMRSASRNSYSQSSFWEAVDHNEALSGLTVQV